jgi:NADH-quinone oxidoreductase subunit E
MLAPELREKAEALVRRYPVGRSALLPLLHLVQAQDGYITDDGIAECAQLLGLTKAEVNAVATFYTMYKPEPLGRHLVSVCTNFSCKVRGAQEVYERLSERLGVGHNGTTDDGAITLEHAECLGNCEGAPVVTVDYFNYECLTPDAAVELVDRVIAGEVPQPTRGFPSPGIREVEYRLAGLGPRSPRTRGQDELSVVSTGDTERPPRAVGGAAREESGTDGTEREGDYPARDPRRQEATDG